MSQRKKKQLGLVSSHGLWAVLHNKLICRLCWTSHYCAVIAVSILMNTSADQGSSVLVRWVLLEASRISYPGSAGSKYLFYKEEVTVQSHCLIFECHRNILIAVGSWKVRKWSIAVTCLF